MPPGPRRHVQGVDDEWCRHRPRRLPADDAAGEHVDDEGHVDDARPRRAVGEVRDPQLVGPGGGEVPLDQIGSPGCTRVGVGGEALLCPGGPADALALMSRATWSRPTSRPALRAAWSASGDRRRSSSASRWPRASARVPRLGSPGPTAAGTWCRSRWRGRSGAARRSARPPIDAHRSCGPDGRR